MRKIITVKTLLKIEAVWGQGVKINPKAFARTEAVPGKKKPFHNSRLTSRGCSQESRDVAVRVGKVGGEVPDIPTNSENVCKSQEVLV